MRTIILLILVFIGRYYTYVILNNYNIMLTASGKRIYLHNIGFNSEGIVSSITEMKSLLVQYENGNIDSFSHLYALTLDNSKIAIYVFHDGGSRVDSDHTIAIFNVDDIINGEDNSTIMPIQEISIPSSVEAMFSDTSGANIKVLFSSALKGLTVASDSENIIGVKYMGKTFLRVTPEMLSATSGDVRSGKTFIGSSGAIETGTLEVNG